jgi:WD40 repeat protein/DNA-binding SARP family transcriptional activator
MAAAARIALLGPLTVDGGEVSLGPRDRVVLTALATRAGDVVSTEQLADALWGERPPESWSKVVAGCVMRLRRALGAESIETTPHGYRLTVLADDVDVSLFEHSLAKGRQLLTLGETERAAFVLGEALALWRGQPLAEAENWEPSLIEAARLDQLRLDAEEVRVDACLQSGQFREVLAEAQALVARQPLRERRWALLALAQYQAGRQGEALRTLRQARQVLASELGVDPGPELVDVEQAILRQDPALITDTARGEASATCPYRGLVPFDVDDADGFFGRSIEVGECLRRLTANGVLVVVGASGCGKSSLVRAGIAAVLQRDGRRVVVVTPGAHPIEALTSLPVNGDVVLVVDQCEEAVSLCADQAERARFFTALAELAERSPLVLAVRADRLADVSASPAFARIVERGLYLLGAMSEEQLRAAIDGPAGQAGLLLEPGLVDLLVREVEGEPGALPLLSHALRQTWERREGRTLTVAGYRATGGVRGAVARSAEQLYEGIPVDQRPVLRDLLLRLVESTPDGEPIRHPLPRRTLNRGEHDELVEQLVRARLATSDGDVVELAHEALAREWPRLRGWLDDDVEGQRIFRHLTTAADAWDLMGRPDSELYRGVRLTQTVAWQDQAGADLTPTEREFLDAGRRNADHELRRQRRSNRRLKALLAGISVVLVAAIVTGLLAVGARQRADAQSNVAEARRVAAHALIEWPYDRALLLAVEAVNLWDSPETRGNLLTTIERSRRATGVIHSGGPRLIDLEISPDGTRAAVVDYRERVTLYDLVARRAVATLAREGTSFRAPAFSSDGQRVAVSSFPTVCWFGERCDESAIEVFDANDLAPLDVRYEGFDAAMDVAFSPSGELIAAVPPLAFSGPTDNIGVWDVDKPAEPDRRLSIAERGADVRLTPDSPPPGWLSFSPDGSRMYAGGAGPTVAFDAGTGERIRTFNGEGALELGPDGRSIAILTSPTTIGLFDTNDGQRRAELVGHEAHVIAAAFSPDSALVATVGKDETVAVWDATTGERLHLLEGHVGTVVGVEFSPDGKTLYTAAADGSIIIWDIEGAGGVARPIPVPALPIGASGTPWVSPAASGVALAGEADHLLNFDDRDPIELQPSRPYDTTWGAYSPDGHRFVTVNEDGLLRLWNVADGEQLALSPGRGVGNRGAVAFTADGAVVVADADGTVTELDGLTLEPTGRSLDVGVEALGIRTAATGVVAVTAFVADLNDATRIVFADLDDGRVTDRVDVPLPMVRANFSTDGSTYAIGGFDGRLRVIDVASGTFVGPEEPVHSGPIASVTFSPDGQTLATIGFDGELALVDPSTGLAHARARPGPANLRVSAGWHPDGDSVVIAYEDGSVIQFSTDSAEWIEHACRVAGRNLTETEWRDAFGDRPYRETCPRASSDLQHDP